VWWGVLSVYGIALSHAPPAWKSHGSENRLHAVRLCNFQAGGAWNWAIPGWGKVAVEGIWNRFRNPILVWEFLKSLNFGRLETVEFRPETLEFRSDISNLGTFLEHFWQSWNFGPFGVSSSSQQRIWYKFESYPYEKTTPDAGDGWARISLFKF
jgi:hypothetical protein